MVVLVEVVVVVVVVVVVESVCDVNTSLYTPLNLHPINLYRFIFHKWA